MNVRSDPPKKVPQSISPMLFLGHMLEIVLWLQRRADFSPRSDPPKKGSRSIPPLLFLGHMLEIVVWHQRRADFSLRSDPPKIEYVSDAVHGPCRKSYSGPSGVHSVVFFLTHQNRVRGALPMLFLGHMLEIVLWPQRRADFSLRSDRPKKGPRSISPMLFLGHMLEIVLWP